MSWKLNFIINALGRGGAILIAFVFTPIFVRMMGLEGFSLVAFFLTFLSITFVLDFALGVTMTRELARYSLMPERADEARDLTRTLEYFYVGIGILIAVSVTVAAPWIARNWLILHTLSVESVRNAVIMMGVAIGFQAPLGMYIGALYGLDRQPTLNLTQFLLALARFGGAALAMWIWGAHITVFFIWQFGFSFVQTLMMRHLVWRHIPAGTRLGQFSLAALRGTFHFTSRVTGTAIASFVVNQLDKIVLSKLMPLSLLGTYQIGNQVGTGAKLLATLVETVVMPRMTIQIEQGDEVGLALLYHEACQLVALLVLPFTAMVAFFAVPLLTVWLGNPTLAAAAAPVAIVLTLGSTCNAMIRVPGGLTLAKGWSGFGLYESTISGALYIPVLIMLIRSDGGLGAAWAWLLLNAACLVVDMPIIHSRYLKTEFGIWALWSLLIPAAISFGLFGAARFLMPKLSPWGATAAVAAIWTVTVLASALAMPRMRAIGARAVGRLHLLVP